MTTWTLLIFLVYSNGTPEQGGAVAINSQRVEFFSKAQCQVALREQRDGFVAAGFKRFTLTCLGRDLHDDSTVREGKQ